MNPIAVKCSELVIGDLFSFCYPRDYADPSLPRDLFMMLGRKSQTLLVLWDCQTGGIVFSSPYVMEAYRWSP